VTTSLWHASTYQQTAWRHPHQSEKLPLRSISSALPIRAIRPLPVSGRICITYYTKILKSVSYDPYDAYVWTRTFKRFFLKSGQMFEIRTVRTKSERMVTLGLSIIIIMEYFYKWGMWEGQRKGFFRKMRGLTSKSPTTKYAYVTGTERI
jgi:hypothetical protein